MVAVPAEEGVKAPCEVMVPELEGLTDQLTAEL